MCSAVENWLADWCNWVQMQFPFSPPQSPAPARFWVVSDCLETRLSELLVSIFSRWTGFLHNSHVIDLKTLVGSTKRSPWSHTEPIPFDTHTQPCPDSYSWRKPFKTQSLLTCHGKKHYIAKLPTNAGKEVLGSSNFLSLCHRHIILKLSQTLSSSPSGSFSSISRCIPYSFPYFPPHICPSYIFFCQLPSFWTYPLCIPTPSSCSAKNLSSPGFTLLYRGSESIEKANNGSIYFSLR